jgi:hypothetical protein
VNAGRDSRCVALTRTPKHKLIIMCRTGVRRPDGGLTRIEGGACPLEEWTKDDLISSILSVEYPPEVTR